MADVAAITPVSSPQKADAQPGKVEDMSELVEDVSSDDETAAAGELFDSKFESMNIGREDDEGSVEYKLWLVGPTPERFTHLVTQCKFRLGEGCGEAIYHIGVEDDGTVRGITPEQLAASLKTLKAMANEVDADTTIVRERDGLSGRVAEVLVRLRPKAGGECVDLRIAVAGNVDSGKSTLIGVFTGSGTMDNGNGLARSPVFMHKHEVRTTETSGGVDQCTSVAAS